MRLISTIEEEEVIHKILTHLKLPTKVPSARSAPGAGRVGEIVYDFDQEPPSSRSPPCSTEEMVYDFDQPPPARSPPVTVEEIVYEIDPWEV